MVDADAAGTKVLVPGGKVVGKDEAVRVQQQHPHHHTPEYEERRKRQEKGISFKGGRRRDLCVYACMYVYGSSCLLTLLALWWWCAV